MFRKNDIVRIKNEFKDRSWYNDNFYKIIDYKMSNDRCLLLNLFTNEKDIITAYYLELSVKEYRKIKIQEINNLC